MSRIYFHGEHGEAEVYGPERHYMGGICADLFVMALNLEHDWDSPEHPSPIRRILSPTHYAADPRYKGREFARTLGTALRVGSDETSLVVEGKRVDVFAATLNTAYVMGSDATKLMARLHGQCELHAYVEGPNRAWLAAMIERGRETDVLRPNMGWEATVELLRSRDDCPVVTSYSVCEQFPNAHVADWNAPIDEESGEKVWDDWYDIEEAERWRLAMEGLRAQGSGLELKPDNWETFYFRDRVNGYQLRRIAEELNSPELATHTPDTQAND
jgi:hypothetical protein